MLNQCPFIPWIYLLRNPFSSNRMVKEQGLQNTLSKQPPLLPSPPPPANAVSKAVTSPQSQNPPSSLTKPAQQSRDLTSSLMNSNVNMMSNQPAVPAPVNGHQGMMGTTASMGMMNNMNNGPTAFSGMVSNGTLMKPVGSNMTSMGTTSNMFQPMSGMNSWPSQIATQNTQMQKPNMSAFDNLMPSQQKPVSMNQMAVMNANTMNSFGSMMSPMQPMNSGSFSKPAAPGVKQLSSSEINDFLS